MEQKRGRKPGKIETLTVGLAAASVLVAACSSSPNTSTSNPNRPAGLTYFTPKGWHTDPQLSLTSGSVAVNGVSSETGQPQSEWSWVVLLGVPKIEVDDALDSGETLVEEFTDPGGNVHVATIPDAVAEHLGTDPANSDTDELATLVGPSPVKFQLGLMAGDVVTSIPTEAIGAKPMFIGHLATAYPGTYIAAAA